jgi:hypothetical protein
VVLVFGLTMSVAVYGVFDILERLGDRPIVADWTG